jgi:hypothetical protein
LSQTNWSISRRRSKLENSRFWSSTMSSERFRRSWSSRLLWINYKWKKFEK